MKNLGPVSRGWLAELGIHTEAELFRQGPIPVWIHLKSRYPKRVNLNLLWAMLALETGDDWRNLTPECKEEARAELRRRGHG